jgi:predicted transcriptional regulator
MSRKNGQRMNTVERSQKTEQALELATTVKPTPTQAAIGEELGLSRQWVSQAFAKLRDQWKSANLEKFGELQHLQLQIFQEMEDLLLNRKIDHKTAMAWWRIRREISSLLGLNEPGRTISLTGSIGHLHKQSDTQLLEGIFDDLEPQEMQKVIDFAAELRANRAAVDSSATVVELVEGEGSHGP